MKNQLVKVQKVLATTSIITALAIFIVALGFMTNLHRLLFDGTFEMYEYYKSVQVLNKAMFDTAIIVVVYAFLLVPFDINKKKPGIFGLILVAGGTIFTALKSTSMFRYIPFFKKGYTDFDFSPIENYTPSPWIFDLAVGLFWTWVVLSVVLTVVCLINFMSNLKERKGGVSDVRLQS